MKVRCKSCGKKFDPEKTTYMCPKCGSWYVEKKGTAQSEYDQSASRSSEWDEMQYTSQRDNVDSVANTRQEKIQDYTLYSSMNTMSDTSVHTTQDSPEYNSPEMVETSRAEESKKNRVKRLVAVGGFAVIGLIFGIAGLIDSNKIAPADDYYENDWDDDDDEDEYGDAASYLYESMTVGDIPSKIVTDCLVGTPIEVVGRNGDRKWCTVLSAKQAELSELDVPAGYELYEIDYQVADNENDQSEFEKREDYINCDLQLRIRTKTGTILTPLAPYDLSMIKSKGDILYDDKVYDEQRTYWNEYADENYIDRDIEEYRGKLLFILTEGDFERLVLYNTYEDDDEKDVENIYIFASDEEKGAKSKASDYDWIVQGKTEASEDAYAISSAPYIQKIEKDTVFTPYKGVNIKCKELLGEEALEEFDSCKETEDWYFVALRMTNISSHENQNPYIYSSYSNDSYIQMDSVYNSPAHDLGTVPPMTTSTLYYIVRVENGYSGDISVTYNNISKDKEYVDSEFTVSLP